MTSRFRALCDRLPPTWRFWLRGAWVALQIVAAMLMARTGMHFYYQGF